MLSKHPSSVFSLWSILLLSACGGGGSDSGGGGGGGGGGGNGLDITLSPAAVNFSVQQHDTLGPPSQIITATAQGGDVYLRLSGYPATLNCAGTTSRCTITVNASAPSGRPIGSSNHSIFVDVCSNELCTQVVRTREIPVTYQVTAGVALTSTPATASLSARQGDASASTSLTFAFTNGTPTSWSAEVVYPAGNCSGWLSATPSGNTLLLTATALEPETWSANLRITYGGTNWTNTVVIPVTYVMHSQPSVEFVSPYVAYTNDPRPVIVRGKGLDVRTHPVRFGGIAATNVVEVSPTELHVTPPAFTTPGTYNVSVDNDNGFPVNTGKYVVLAPHTWPYTAVTLPVTTSSLSKRHVYFDAERQAGYYTLETNAIRRVRFEAGAWTVDTLPLANVLHFDVSPDGQRLYALNSGVNTTNSISELDLDSLSLLRTYPFDNGFTDIAILNTGQALIHSLGSSARFTFPLERLSQWHDLGGFSQVSVVSPNRRRVVAITDGTGAGRWIYEESTSEFRELPDAVDQFGPSHVGTDRAGTRIVAGNDVLDANGVMLGSMAGLTGFSGVAVNPEGTRAYVVVSRSDADRSTLRVFDISGAAGPFPQLGSDIALPDYLGRYSTPTRISNDGRYLIMFGSEHFIVMPVP